MARCTLLPLIEPLCQDVTHRNSFMNARDIPPPVFLGFCAKEFWPTPDGWRQEGVWSKDVVEVASAGDCIASRPPGWIERWDFNCAYCWSEEESAWACVPESDREGFRIYAFSAIPVVFGKSSPPQRIANQDLFSFGSGDLPPEPDLSSYPILGYDVVQYAGYANWGCSPLSCNGMGAEFRVNRYCLLDTASEAFAAAASFAVEEPEPGPFMIIEVRRGK